MAKLAQRIAVDENRKAQAEGHRHLTLDCDMQQTGLVERVNVERKKVGLDGYDRGPAAQFTFR